MSETKTKAVGIRFPADLLEKIDQDRGKVPRSTWIIAFLKKKLVQETGQK